MNSPQTTVTQRWGNFASYLCQLVDGVDRDGKTFPKVQQKNFGCGFIETDDPAAAPLVVCFYSADKAGRQFGKRDQLGLGIQLLGQ